MTTAIAEAPAALRLDWPFFGAALLSIAVLVALVLLDGQPASAGLLLCGFALGIVFLKAEFSFTASWRRFIVHGHADGLLGALLLIAVAALVVVPVAALVPGFGGAIAPLGPSLVIGAFLFGIGMQLANGCGSGTLYTAGGGSGRMLVTLAFFILGSLIGSLHLPVFLALGGIDPVLASAYAGAWGGLALTLASLALGGGADRGGGAPARCTRATAAGDRDRRARHRSAVDRGLRSRTPSVERDLRLHSVGWQDRECARCGSLHRRVLAMAGAREGRSPTRC